MQLEENKRNNPINQASRQLTEAGQIIPRKTIITTLHSNQKSYGQLRNNNNPLYTATGKKGDGSQVNHPKENNINNTPQQPKSDIAQGES